MNNDKHQAPQKITSFCLANSAQLQALKDFYGFHMSEIAMRELQNHFYKVEVREPSLDELMLIDRLYCANKGLATSIHLKSLTTSDKNVGESFSDLMQKLNAIGADKEKLSLTSLLSAPKRILDCAGKATNVNMPNLFADDSSFANTLCNRSLCNQALLDFDTFKCTVADNSKEFKNLSDYEVNDDDRFVLFSLDEGFDSREPLMSRVESLIKENYDGIVFKYAKATSKKGIIGNVLESSNGAYLNLSQLQAINYTFDPRNPSATVPGGFAVAIVSESTLSFALRAAKVYGLIAIPFGRPTKVKRLTVIRGNGAPISISCDFLRSIGSNMLYSADIPFCEQKGYAISDTAPYVKKANESLISACALAKSSFIGSCEALIYSVAKLVSCGADYKNVITSVCINQKNTTNSKIISQILGVYRVRAELELLSGNDSIRELDGGEFCAFAASKCPKVSISNTLTDKPSRVYLLCPRAGDDGLPNFNDLRMLFEYVNKLISSGALLSVRALSCVGLKQTLTDMGAELFTEDIEDVKNSPCGAFVVESSENIDGIVLFSKNQ